MSLSNKLEITDIFNRLETFYILIFIHDLDDFRLQDLNSLAIRLEGKLQLDERLNQIHQTFIQISQQNILQKKAKKKKPKVIQQPPLPFPKNQNSTFLSDISYNEAYSLNQSVDYSNLIPNQPMKIVSKKIGTIYDGKLFINLPVKQKGKNLMNFSFEIRGEQKKSSLAVATIQKLKIIKKVEKITLEVAERLHDFDVFGNSNVLGLDFLSQNKVVMECNYRSEINKFTLSFTQ